MKQVYFAKNTYSLLIQLINKSVHFYFHSILYFYFMFNILSLQIDDLFILVSPENH